MKQKVRFGKVWQIRIYDFLALFMTISSSMYRTVVSSITSRLEAHAGAGFFKLLMKGIFNPYVL